MFDSLLKEKKDSEKQKVWIRNSLFFMIFLISTLPWCHIIYTTISLKGQDIYCEEYCLPAASHYSFANEKCFCEVEILSYK
jgi:hypothetical protein